MGQFSWRDCVTGKPILDNVEKTCYLLVPAKFGSNIEEPCYDGYGHFGGKDVYDLIPEWNKDMIPEIIRRIKNGTWQARLSDSDEGQLMKYYNGEPISVPLRHLGIVMACYDEDNFSLEFPIKITYRANMSYEDCKPSPSDPNQGWGDDDEDDEEEYY